jgi:hypothetical protein
VSAIAQRRVPRPRLARLPALTPRLRSRSVDDYLDARLHIAALSLVAGAIHAVVAVPHLDEYWLFGSFFVALAAFQLGWGIQAYRRPSSSLYLIGAAASLAVIGIWVASRTIGLPVGPNAGTAEAVGPLDAVATAVEAAMIGLCIAFLRSERRLPAPIAIIRPLAIGLMMAGLLALTLGAGHRH